MVYFIFLFFGFIIIFLFFDTFEAEPLNGVVRARQREARTFLVPAAFVAWLATPAWMARLGPCPQLAAIAACFTDLVQTRRTALHEPLHSNSATFDWLTIGTGA